jgi:hypothetical protein
MTQALMPGACLPHPLGPQAKDALQRAGLPSLPGAGHAGALHRHQRLPPLQQLDGRLLPQLPGLPVRRPLRVRDNLCGLR